MNYKCIWPWTTLVILSDGRAVCGCGDPYAQKVLGDTNKDSIYSIWNGDKINLLRQELSDNGYSEFCEGCPLKTYLKDGEEPVAYGKTGDYPSRLFIEPSSMCNLSCYKACCGKGSDILKHRKSRFLHIDLFRRIIEETGKYLTRIDLFNYGETFLNRNATKMCIHIKENYPDIYLFASTNGLAFTKSSIREIINSSMDEIAFSIDGASQEAYEQYRSGGSFNKAIFNLQELISERNKQGSRLPYITWRYILFKWNDSDEEMKKAIEIAEDIRVDRLAWELTDHPADACSKRFLSGSYDYKRIINETWDKSFLGNAIPGHTPMADISLKHSGPLSFLPLTAKRNKARSLKIRVKNLSQIVFHNSAMFGRRFVRLGAQLYTREGILMELNLSRASLKSDLYPGSYLDLDLELPPIGKPGIYRLKFDMVMEGIDWFEKAGSKIMWKTLIVI